MSSHQTDLFRSSSRTTPRTPKLWLALRLVDLPLSALGIDSRSTKVIAVAEKQQIIFANAKARSIGIKRGMNTTTARLLGECDILERNPALEQKALAQLTERMYQFTPYIETYISTVTPETGLLLELSRCLKLFSGLLPLSERIFNDLHDTPYRFEHGLAHTSKGAWLLSYQPYAITGKENEHLYLQRLKQTPIQCLNDYPEAVSALNKMGFSTLGDIAVQISEQSISSIKKRFGKSFTQTICDIFSIEHNFSQSRLFSHQAETYQPQEIFFSNLQFDYPVSQVDQLYCPMGNMLGKLNDYLRKRQLECQKIEWKLYDIHHNSETLTIYCDSVQSHSQILLELTRVQLEHRELPFEVDSLELLCRQTIPIKNNNQIFNFENNAQSVRCMQDFAITVAKLKARLGEAAVFKIGYCDSHIPEKSNITLATSDAPNQTLPELHQKALRPTWLFDPPIPITERQQGLYWRGPLQLLAGPERIEGNWWQTATARDYFLARRQDHVRLWIFLDLHKNEWYVQGIFG